MHLMLIQHCQMDSSRFCPLMVIMYASNITSNGLCISVGGCELLEGSFTDILLLFLLFLLSADQSEPWVVKPSCVFRRLFRG